MDTSEETMRGYEFAERVLKYESYYVIEIDKRYLANHLFNGYIPIDNFLDAMRFDTKKECELFMKQRNLKGNIREVYAELRRK